MRGSKEDMPKTVDTDDVVMHEAEWGDMHVEFYTVNKKLEVTPLLRGLPDKFCQCPHWGYVIRGRFTIKYKDREEIVNAGDAYYAAPGHTEIFDAGTEFVVFSPKDKLKKSAISGVRSMKLPEDFSALRKQEEEWEHDVTS